MELASHTSWIVWELLNYVFIFKNCDITIFVIINLSEWRLREFDVGYVFNSMSRGIVNSTPANDESK